MTDDALDTDALDALTKMLGSDADLDPMEVAVRPWW
jgi:hypothetical protein